MAVAINTICCAINFVLLISLRNICGYLLTNDAEVADLVAHVLVIYAFAQIFDGTQGVRTARTTFLKIARFLDCFLLFLSFSFTRRFREGF